MRNAIRYLVFIVLGLLLTFLLMPGNPAVVPLPTPKAAASYAEAEKLVKTLQAKDGPEVNPVCRTRYESSGQQTDYVLVYLHGFTNCPEQGVEIAAEARKRGWNVLMPRMPKNGLADRSTPELGRLKGEELALWADEVGRAAQGLGKKVVLVGLSVGGQQAAYITERWPTTRTVIMAPCFGLLAKGSFVSRQLIKGFEILPDKFMDYGSAEAMKTREPMHAYVGFSTHGISQAIRLGKYTLAGPKPKTNDVRVILNHADTTVDNEAITALVDHWRSLGSKPKLIQIPKEQALIHDLVDPKQPTAKIVAQRAVFMPEIFEGLK